MPESKSEVTKELFKQEYVRFSRDYEQYKEDYQNEQNALNPTDSIPYVPGCCEESVPILRFEYSLISRRNPCLPYFVIILNFILPGTGTILAACVDESGTINCSAIGVGLMQLLTTIILFGFLWSWWWTLRIMHKTKEYHKMKFAFGRQIRGSFIRKTSTENEQLEKQFVEDMRTTFRLNKRTTEKITRETSSMRNTSLDTEQSENVRLS